MPCDHLPGNGTPEQIAGRLRLGIEPGLRAVCAETIHGWIYRAGQKTERLWRFLTRRHARRRTIEQPAVWKFCACVVTHPDIPT